jgi:hypothetical protein
MALGGERKNPTSQRELHYDLVVNLAVNLFLIAWYFKLYR